MTPQHAVPVLDRVRRARGNAPSPLPRDDKGLPSCGTPWPVRHFRRIIIDNAAAVIP